MQLLDLVEVFWLNVVEHDNTINEMKRNSFECGSDLSQKRDKNTKSDKPSFDCLQSMPGDESANEEMHVKVTKPECQICVKNSTYSSDFIHNRFG